MKNWSKIISNFTGLFFLAACSYEPMSEVNSLIDRKRLVEADDYYQFTVEFPANSCLIFYPGGRVKPMAYGPFLQRVADAGFTSFLIKSPFDLAILDTDAADSVKSDTQAVSHCQYYVVGGHSLGGVVAAKYAVGKPDHALLLVAAYPMESTSLVNHPAPVISISASKDGLSTPEKVAMRNHLLPGHTRHIEIAGGNHAQFGWYGIQDKDGEAAISRETQQQILTDETLALLSLLAHPD